MRQEHCDAQCHYMCQFRGKQQMRHFQEQSFRQGETRRLNLPALRAQ